MSTGGCLLGGTYYQGVPTRRLPTRRHVCLLGGLPTRASAH